MQTGLSIIQHKILDYLREHHPTQWVHVAGTNLQVSKGLVKRGLVEIRCNPRKQYQIRLCPGARLQESAS